MRLALLLSWFAVGVGESIAGERTILFSTNVNSYHYEVVRETISSIPEKRGDEMFPYTILARHQVWIQVKPHAGRPDILWKQQFIDWSFPSELPMMAQTFDFRVDNQGGLTLLYKVSGHLWLTTILHKLPWPQPIPPQVKTEMVDDESEVWAITFVDCKLSYGPNAPLLVRIKTNRGDEYFMEKSGATWMKKKKP